LEIGASRGKEGVGRIYEQGCIFTKRINHSQSFPSQTFFLNKATLPTHPLKKIHIDYNKYQHSWQKGGVVRNLINTKSEST